MEFDKAVKKILKETTVSGGAVSAFGPNVSDTATTTSGDNIARNDARNVYGGVAGVLTRGGMIGKKRKPKKKK